MTQKTFIKKIGNAAVKYYKTYMILPSLTIAQAILESGWGKSELARKYHNYFGMKWANGCGCKYKSYKTVEQRNDGTYYTITAKFRKYSSLSRGIKGYYDFLQYPRYKALKGVTDYTRACELIKECGWATSLSYTKLLISLIEQYDLQRFDSKVIANPSNNKKREEVKWTPRIGDKVMVCGKIYGNGDGSGGSLNKNSEVMYVVDIVRKDWYKYYIGVSSSKGGVRQGWSNESSMKKI